MNAHAANAPVAALAQGALLYLDYAATTPLDAEAYAAMLPFLAPHDAQLRWANAASAHAAGLRVQAAVERARAEVAALIGAEPGEIVWTSGATESNNLAIKGALEFRGLAGAHIVTSRTEHKCVLDTCRYLETRGVGVTYLKPGTDGIVTPEQVLGALSPQTALVSLMWVNNETGAMQDVARLAPALRERGVLFHVDAAQAAGKVAIDLREIPIDLLSLSAHKLYGPKGAGALFVRKRPRARLAPQMHGGGHEQGMRSGTLPTHQIVGMGAACAVAARRRVEDADALSALREQLWQRLMSGLSRVQRNSPPPERCAPHILNVSFEGVDGEAVRASLPQLAVSSGAACSSATQEPSYVLRALGRADALANASLRFSLGRPTTAAEIDAAAAEVIVKLRRLRQLSPDWDADAAELPAAGIVADVDAPNPYGYSAQVWRLFNRTPAAGCFPPGTPGVITGCAETRSTQAVLQLQLRLEADRVVDARFLARGCPTTIAVGAWLAQAAVGRRTGELAALDAAALRRALEIPEERAHCSLMGEDAIRALLAELKR
jgi:cysteine desulfurase